MLSPELIAKISHLEFKTKSLATDVLAGDYVSAFKNRGMAFDEVREYIPGDDVRSIDWNVTARMSHPFVKVFREERDMTVMLLVDVSGSQLFSSQGRFKVEVAAELAALIAWIALRSNDRVGAILFSDRIEATIPPSRGRGAVWNLIRTLLTHKPEGHGTNLRLALETMERVTRRRSMAFLISDFLAEGFESALAVAARKHDFIAAHISDPLDTLEPGAGFVELLDLESGQRLIVDTDHPKTVEKLRAYRLGQKQHLESLFRHCGVDAMNIGSWQEPADVLAKFLRTRQPQRRGGR